MEICFGQESKSFCPVVANQNGVSVMQTNGYFEFLTHFVDLDDPRQDCGNNHLLIDMVGLVFYD